ncbi:MAG TPA: M3 family metallopeptidase, partial [Leptospiraceae bacterium]|nr:M3 family metallopeptidase [Leptospiraceae bacterium]
MSFITENYSEETGKKYERKFFSKTFDPRNREELEKEYIEFLKEDVQTKEGLERFTEKWSELAAIVDEAGSLSYVGMTSDTKNEKAEKDYLHLVENIFPLCQVYEDRVKEKFLSSPALNQLNSEYYALFIKQVRSEKEIYREENISLHTKDSLLAQNYQKITGAWMAEFEGKRRTMQEINVFLESPDRDLRERAYRTRVGVHLQDAENLENLFDEMLSTRAKIASNAGFSNYRDYKFVAGGRFDYTPSDCLRFHDAISETIVPLLSEWTKEKCNKLGISSLRPWDISADPEAKEQIRAFSSEEEFLEKTGKVFDSIHPRLGNYFQF